MLNQKGIAFIPLLFWIAISVIGVAAVGEATGLHISLNNVPTPEIKNSNTGLLPSVAPLDSPNPTPKVTPEVANNQVNNSNSQLNNAQGVVTHDSTRTGNIIKYKEWCKGNQEISVYENELITKKSSDGKTYSMTQGDWDCYEKKLKDSQVKTQVQSKVNCQVGNQWILMETKDQCSKIQAEFYKRKPTENDTFLKQLPQFNNPPIKNDPSSEELYAQELERKRVQLDQDCRQEKTWIDEEKNRKIDTENSSHQGSLESVRNRYAGIGMGSSGDRYAAEGVAIISHQRRLENIENLYNQKLSELRAKGCNF